jgi:hypothetical protein
MPSVYSLSYKTPRVVAGTLDLLEDESVYVRTLTALEMSVLRQMTFPRVYYPWSLVDDQGQVQIGVPFPTEYQEALEALELKLSPASPDEGGSVGEIFVDRNVTAGWDFIIGAGLTADNNWHYLDLRSIFPDVTPTRVLFVRYVRDNLVNSNFLVKPFVESGDYTSAILSTQVANVYNYDQVQVYMGSGLGVAYKITTGMDVAALSVLGWWKPAS